MIRKTRLFTPGPTQLLPAAQTAMASFGMHHRTAEFRALYSNFLDDMQLFVVSRNDVMVQASSGTEAMEAAVPNLTSPGDGAVVGIAGKVVERWIGLVIV